MDGIRKGENTRMLSVSEIKTFIDNDAASVKKQLARTGLRYYEADHDIKNYRIFFIDADGQLQEDKQKSNIKISHPFFTELVDQEVQYMLSGKDGFVKSDNPELQTELNAYFNDNEDFVSELYEVISGCVAKGFEHMYAYKNEEGRTAFQCADSMGVVEVEAKHAEDKKNHIIYWYVEQIDKDGKKIKRIQDWDDSQTFFYKQTDDGQIEKDDSVQITPRPHAIYKKDGDKATYFESYGFIPFFRLDNCKKQFSGLKPIKALIDDYDLMSCGLSNNIQDTNEALYVVKGFQGDNLDELMLNMKAKKHVGVDEDGGVDIKTIDIPYQARQTKLDLDEKNIYRFGMGLNTAGLKDTAATTNIAIKAAYSLLELKANKLLMRLKKMLKDIVKVVLAEINTVNKTDYQLSDVFFDFQTSTMTNEQENIQNAKTEAETEQIRINTILNVAASVGDEQTLKSICEVMEWDFDDLQGKIKQMQEEQSLTAVRTALNNAAVDVPIAEE